MKKNYILGVSLKPLIPFIMIFGLYVQFHGDFGPGGGFQAGVIFAAAIILYTLVFGLRAATEVVSARTLEILVAADARLQRFCKEIPATDICGNRRFHDAAEIRSDRRIA